MSVAPKFVQTYFAPDKDSSWGINPGVCTEVGNMVPSIRGTLVNYTCSSAENISAIAPFTKAGSPLNAAVLKRTGNSSGVGARLFVGTQNNLLEMGAANFANVSRSANVYAASRWSFASFGDKMFACTGYGSAQPSEYPQYSQGVAGTAFAALTGSPNNPPKAALCVVQANFLVLFNVYDGTNWYADGWCSSGLGNTASWATTTADLTTQANNGRLIATPGPICDAVNQRDTIVVYKADSMYVMTYTGNPYTWSSRLISDQIGQTMHGGVVVVNGVHYFIHRSGVYSFDGSYPKNIGLGWVNNYVSNKLYGINPTFLLGYGSVLGVHDEENNLIIWYFGTAEESAYSASQCNMALAYNYVNGQWGWIDRTWEELSTPYSSDENMCCPVVASRTDLALLGLGTTDTITPLTVGIVGGNMYLRRILIGTSSSLTQSYSTVTTGDIGDEYSFTRLSRIKPNLNAGDDNLQTATCYVDGKPSKADFYNHEGFLMTATATGTGAGSATFPLIQYTANYRRTILSDDYLAFEFNSIQGSVLTTLGVRLTYSDASTRDFLTTSGFITTGTWTQYSLLIPDTGKVLASVTAMFGVPGATGLHQAVVRRIRITSGLGVLRLRLFTGTETRLLTTTPSATNYSNYTGFGSPSLGTAYTYDTTKKRFDGSVSNRWLRAKLTLYNKTDIAGLYVSTQQAGTE